MPDLRIERVVVTGGRRFTDGARIEADLRALLSCGLRRVAEGACHRGGADNLAYDAWHLLVNRSTERYPVKPVDGLHQGAPRNRNVRMLEAERPDLVLAYPDPDSRGTWHCVREAVSRDIPTIIWGTVAQLSAAGIASIATNEGPTHYAIGCDLSTAQRLLEVLRA